MRTEIDFTSGSWPCGDARADDGSRTDTFYRLYRLLRIKGKRPSDRQATNQRQELPPSHPAVSMAVSRWASRRVCPGVAMPIPPLPRRAANLHRVPARPSPSWCRGNGPDGVAITDCKIQSRSASGTSRLADTR
jgi:hypothetical protein